MTTSSGKAPGGVGETAIGAAMMRARESERANPLFDDPLAAAFVDAAPPVFADGPTSEDDPALATLEAEFQDAVSVRTRFYDDVALDAVGTSCQQVVILGAGLDTRAFRLALPSRVRLYEIDTPEVLAFKEHVIARNAAGPRCARRTVAADLSQPWTAKLHDAGFDSDAPTVWIVEGLIPYLSAEAAERLLAGVTELSSSGSVLAVDQPSIPRDSLLAQAQAVQAMDDITSMWRGGLQEDALAWLDAHGWDAERVDVAALASSYGRSVSAVANDAFVRAARRHT